MKHGLGFSLAAAGLAAAQVVCADIEKSFVKPPDSARPHTWWHWMNGNITKEGITADLEAMARVGVGGAQIFNAGEGIPHGPIQFNSPEWIGLVKHSAKEARRLGLEICIHNCAGWSSSGGPWNTPENSMKVVVTSEQQVKGPARFDGALAQPTSKLNFYRDIAVLAFRTPVGERVRMCDAKPVIAVSEAKQDAYRVADGNAGTAVQFGLPKPQAPAFIQFSFAQPFTARMLALTPGPGMQGCSGRIDASDDGKAFQTVDTFSMSRGSEVRTFAFKPVTAKAFRTLFLSASHKMTRLGIAEVDLSAKVGVENLAGKIFLDRGGDVRGDAAADIEPDAVVQGEKVVDLTAKLTAEGRLAWDVPEGEWTILRLGYTANGRNNHPAPAEGTGLECDKLSKEAAQAHWDGHMGKILAELGKYAGQAESGLNNVLIDSYEVGSQNWTRGFADAFKRRRGYDLTRFLPALTGRVVDTPEVTERFLWDFRRVIADLFAENYSGQFAEMAHRAGLQYSVEPYGNCPSDDLQYGSYGDIPMSEFWPGNDSNPGNAKLAASVAHVYGKKYVGAESFTASPEAGKWLKDPYSIKAQGDAVYCAGVNRIIYHRYAHQPWTEPTRYPGMTMGQWGTHFERSVTWWEQGRDWLAYQARCQYLLQEGRFVADVCFYSGEGAPNSLRGGGLPPGYDYDGCDTAALKLMTVKDGRIVLPSGMTYRVLALPGDTAMTPAVLTTIQALADAGATIVGPKPERSPSLSGYPACDAEVKRLAGALWGKGVRDQSPADALAALGVKPDFACTNAQSRVMSIHRVIEGADVYFVSNQKPVADDVTCTFRVSGKAPELWHPDTGAIEPAPVYAEQDGRTSVPLRFDPAGSVFVVFRKAAAADHAVAVRRVAQQEAKAPVFELAVLKAEYGAFGDEVDPECKDVTAQVKSEIKAGARNVRASNDLAGDPAPMTEKEMKLDYLLNGEAKSVRIDENRTFELPAGAEVVRAVYGLIAEKPEPQAQTVDVTAKLASLVKDGALAARVDNALCGGKDPAFMTVKELRADYTYKGIRKHVRVRENQTLALPEQSEQASPLPAYTLAASKEGAVELQAWKPGAFEIETVAGRLLKAEVADVPKPVEIAGPWELAFPPNWGAPATVTLDKLISWTAHADSGVKYFSGTAEYRKTFAWDAKLQKGERYLLDLGDLKNIAEVELNGDKLGLLWKPPFRLDVTGSLRAGKNTLHVKVTNLWPNRLIGDEQLPEDREWDGIRLKAWPQWVLDGKPSPTGRFTFTTWYHWTKDDEPLPSGLFGPVVVRTVKTVELK
jgi:hypothetical protein